MSVQTSMSPQTVRRSLMKNSIQSVCRTRRKPYNFSKWCQWCHTECFYGFWRPAINPGKHCGAHDLYLRGLFIQSWAVYRVCGFSSLRSLGKSRCLMNRRLIERNKIIYFKNTHQFFLCCFYWVWSYFFRPPHWFSESISLLLKTDDIVHS